MLRIPDRQNTLFLQYRTGFSVQKNSCLQISNSPFFLLHILQYSQYEKGYLFMETYNYDAAAVPEGDADTTPAAAPETDAAAAGTSDTAQSGFSSQPPIILTYPDSSSNDLQVSPGFGPYGDVMPSLPSNNHGSPNTGGCINCAVPTGSHLQMARSGPGAFSRRSFPPRRRSRTCVSTMPPPSANRSIST